MFAFGQPGDQPVAGDWNGDGIDTIGVYRPSTGQFLLRNSNTNGIPEDFVPLLAVIPLYGDSAKTIQTSNVIVTIKTDTLAKVSKYICRQRIL